MRARIALTASIPLTLLLAACGGGSGSEEDEAGTADPEAAEISPEIRLAHSDQPQTMDPISTTASVARNIGQLVYEPLFVVDADQEVQPMLAEDFEFNDDNSVLTITIRENVPFHNGEILDSEDVVASLERWTELTAPGMSFFSEAEYEAIDELTVEVDLGQPMALAPLIMADNSRIPAFIMSTEIIEESGDSAITEHIGTGPYEFGEWATDQYVRLDRFEDYASREEEPHGHAGSKHANFESMYFDFVTDSSTRMNGLSTGEYDLIHGLNPDNVSQVDGFSDADYQVGASGILTGMFNKSDESMMGDLAMREAVIAAIEPAQIMLAAYADEEFFGATSSLMDADSQWYIEPEPEFAEFHQEVNQDLVDEKMQEAGYDGEEVRILASSDQDDYYNAGVMLQQQLEEAGFNATLQTLDWPSMLDAYLDPGAYDIAIDAYANYPALPPTFLFLSEDGEGWPDYEPMFEAGQRMVYAGEDDAAMDAMVDFQQAFNDYLPVAKIGDRTTIYGVNHSVQGFEHISGQGPVYHNMYLED